MYVICVSAFDKRNLPEMMINAIKHQRDHGALDGLIHVMDDITRPTTFGEKMVSYWGTPEEVDPRDRDSLAKAVKEKLYSSEDLRELVSIIWDTFIENYSNVNLFREDVLNVLQDPDIIRGLLCVLNKWSDRLQED